MEIQRMVSPSLEDLFAAGEVCETRWPFLRALHTGERFAALQKMGVELIAAKHAARNDGRWEGVCFVLPCRFPFAGKTLEWVSLFQLAVRPETQNLGAMLMLRIMSTYPAIVSMGVTEDATRMYQALRWRCYPEVWRGVHPVRLRSMANDYADRLDRTWKRAGMRFASGIYDALSRPAESMMAAGIGFAKGEGAPVKRTLLDLDPELRLEAKLRLIASYFPTGQVGATRFVNAGGIGRILNGDPAEWGGWREHARIWCQLRSGGAKFCELLASTPAAKARAIRLGYVPVRMPVWYQDKNGMVALLLEALRRNEVSFLHTDKAV